MLAQRSQDKVPPPDVRKLVEGRRRDRPNTSTAWLAGEESSPRQCAFCERVGTQDMPMCSKCVAHFQSKGAANPCAVDASWLDIVEGIGMYNRQTSTS